MRYDINMPENDEFWDLYWEMHLQPMENLGKRAAILATSKLIRQQGHESDHLLRLLELGCGEGQVIGTLLNAHSQVCSIKDSVGVDYNPQFLAQCRHDYPNLRCIAGDFSDPALLAGLGKFDIILLVNTLHEVFSDAFSPKMNEIDIPLARLRVDQTLSMSAAFLQPGSWMVLFDGLEPGGDLTQMLSIRFHDSRVRQDFETFVQQYQPLHITYQQLKDPLSIALSRRDFTRFITKSIFLRKGLWESERLQSYQYFTEEDYRQSFARLGLDISILQTLTVNEEKWRALVDIITPGVNFPEEHILILAKKIPDHSP
jgi:SAM-dependent methyltransferase